MLERLSGRGRMVVTRAEEEARRLGHAQVGTEHLLLGILADSRSSACQVLLGVGATLDGARSKVAEAVGPVTAGTPLSDLTLTDRARRALERADRLSLRRRDSHVEPGHILLSLLDVEGRAGQVLRGLGVDIPVLRRAVEVAMDQSSEPSGPDEPEQRLSSPLCSACGTALAGALSHRVVSSRDSEGNRRDFVIAFCASCGASLGAFLGAPQGPGGS